MNIPVWVVPKKDASHICWVLVRSPLWMTLPSEMKQHVLAMSAELWYECAHCQTHYRKDVKCAGCNLYLPRPHMRYDSFYTGFGFHDIVSCFLGPLNKPYQQREIVVRIPTSRIVDAPKDNGWKAERRHIQYKPTQKNTKRKVIKVLRK
jgi:hypothetical protein